MESELICAATQTLFEINLLDAGTHFIAAAARYQKRKTADPACPSAGPLEGGMLAGTGTPLLFTGKDS